MSNMFGSFMTKTFSDLFPSIEEWDDSYNNLPSAFKGMIENDVKESTYYLLYAYYGNSTISGLDENQWIMRLWANIYSRGPKWMKEVDLNKAIRKLQLSELTTGALAVYNHAYNPATELKTETDLITTVNEQNTTRYTKGTLDAYTQYLELLKQDPTESYMKSFRKLFLTIVEPYDEQLYVTETEGE